MPQKVYLLTPGPTPIPESVRLALASPILHHRTPAFEAIFTEVHGGLKELFKTKQDVLILTATGTGAMDASVANLFSPGDAVITVSAGKFGERWGKIAKAYGLSVHELKLGAGESVDPAAIEQALTANPNVKAVLFQASETSTGARMPVQEIARLCRKHNVLSVVDAITACGVFPLPMDEWEIDVLMTGSQKALMLPPGLAFIALSDRAWQANATATNPRFYFDLARERQWQPKNQTAWTPAISLIQGLQESLRILLKEEGLENCYARHEKLAAAMRAGVKAMGLELLAKNAPSTAVTAVKIPEALLKDGKSIPKRMRDQWGVTIVGGQDELEGKILRLSHFGHCDLFDVTTALSAIELTFKSMGYPVKLGAAAGAALEVYSS